jgi:hypothetical protein
VPQPGGPCGKRANDRCVRADVNVSHVWIVFTSRRRICIRPLERYKYIFDPCVFKIRRPIEDALSKGGHVVSGVHSTRPHPPAWVWALPLVRARRGTITNALPFFLPFSGGPQCTSSPPLHLFRAARSLISSRLSRRPRDANPRRVFRTDPAPTPPLGTFRSRAEGGGRPSIAVRRHCARLPPPAFLPTAARSSVRSPLLPSACRRFGSVSRSASGLLPWLLRPEFDVFARV